MESLDRHLRPGVSLLTTPLQVHASSITGLVVGCLETGSLPPGAAVSVNGTYRSRRRSGDVVRLFGFRLISLGNGRRSLSLHMLLK